MKPIKCAIIGATGMVGTMFLKIIKERELPVSQLKLFSSARTAGQVITTDDGCKYITEELTEHSFDEGFDVCFFALRNELAKKYAPIAAAKGCIVIDNSSAFRTDPAIPLVVPEVNFEDLKHQHGIIANPNCCAAPAVIALKPLLNKYGIKRVVISTYQSVSGAGIGGIHDLKHSDSPPTTFLHPIAGNLIPHIGDFEPDGYTGEEKKLIAEIKKMLHTPELRITATTVRVPVYVAHSLSMNIELNATFDVDDVKNLLAASAGIKLVDDIKNNQYPMPFYAAGDDVVHIGRIRRDDSCDNALNLWLSSDNTRKGAALNAVQIAETLFKGDNI